MLGIGANGHIGFNEPGSSLGSRTRVKTLTEQTRRDNARFFSGIDEVPRHVITQGLGTIGQARHLVLIATGGTQGTIRAPPQCENPGHRRLCSLGSSSPPARHGRRQRSGGELSSMQCRLLPLRV